MTRRDGIELSPLGAHASRTEAIDLLQPPVLSGDLQPAFLNSGGHRSVEIPHRLRRVLVELKAVGTLHPIHEAQLLTYLRLAGLRVGLLMNFNVPVIKDGIVRRVL